MSALVDLAAWCEEHERSLPRFVAMASGEYRVRMTHPDPPWRAVVATGFSIEVAAAVLLGRLSE